MHRFLAPCTTSKRYRFGGSDSNVKQRRRLRIQFRDLAAHLRPRCAVNVPPSVERARGTPDARCVRSLMRKVKKRTSVDTTKAPDASGVPHAMVLTACSARPPVFDPWVEPPLEGTSTPQPALCTRSEPWRCPMAQGDAPGYRDLGRPRRCGRHRLGTLPSPASRRTSTRVSDRTSIASTASRPANRDDRDTPLSSGRDKGI